MWLRARFLSDSGSFKRNFKKFIQFIKDNTKINTVVFLMDKSGHLNELNKKLQGKHYTIINLTSDIMAFQCKLEVYAQDLKGDKLFFPTLKGFVDKRGAGEDSHDAFVSKLMSNFKDRFGDFNLSRTVLTGITNPFDISDLLEFMNKAKQVFEWVAVAALC